MYCSWRISVVRLNSQHHKNQPLRHDRDVDDLSKPAEELHERTQRLDSLQRQAVVQGCPGLQA